MRMLLIVLLLLTTPAQANENNRPQTTYDTMCLSLHEMHVFIVLNEIKFIIVHANKGDVMWVRNTQGKYCRLGTPT